MDTIRSIMPYFSFVLSCIALGISLVSLMNNVDEELKILEEVTDYLKEAKDYLKEAKDYLEEEYEQQKQ